jgi:hypothetical protein
MLCTKLWTSFLYVEPRSWELFSCGGGGFSPRRQHAMIIYDGFLVEAVDAPHRLVHREPDRLGEKTGKGYRVPFSESGIVAVRNASCIKLLSSRVL